LRKRDHPHGLAVEQIADLLGRALRNQNALRRAAFLIGHAGLGHGRHLRHRDAALGGRHREGAEAALLDLPGLAFTRSTTSFIDSARKSGLTEPTLGEAATSVIGAKSFTGSYEIFAYMLGLTMKPVLTTRMV